ERGQQRIVLVSKHPRWAETDRVDILRGRTTGPNVIQIFMAIGGIPHYLNHIRAGRSAAQNIDAICFRPSGMLRDEYDSLLTALFDHDSMHQTIVRALATSWTGLVRDELIHKAKLTSGGRLTKALDDLTLSGFVQETNSWNKKSKETVYRLVDERGPDHLKCFRVAARVAEREFAPAWGGSKKEAEQRAAENALAELSGDRPPHTEV
ncbi:MAG: putative dsRNA-binding protein, partial [Planctomycetaceae bacterium]